jgi:hypothetical protein
MYIICIYIYYTHLKNTLLTASRKTSALSIVLWKRARCRNCTRDPNSWMRRTWRSAMRQGIPELWLSVHRVDVQHKHWMFCTVCIYVYICIYIYIHIPTMGKWWDVVGYATKHMIKMGVSKDRVYPSNGHQLVAKLRINHRIYGYHTIRAPKFFTAPSYRSLFEKHPAFAS